MELSRKFKFTVVVVAALALFVASSDAWAAKDSVRAKVNQVSPSITALTAGGSTLSQGTFSSSASIKVQYELLAFSFPSGTIAFGTFNLGVEIQDRSSDPGADTDYAGGLSVTIDQPGSDGPNLLLSASPSSYSGITGPGNLGTSTVTITTNCTVANPCSSVDGTELVANLQFTGSPSGRLDTSVKVQVRIKLVHPTECVRLFNFLTDQDLTTDANSTEVVVVKSGKNAGKVNSATPFGQFSDNVLVANTCSSISSFDLKITLDPSFDTNPNDNPGNAVFTYLAGEALDLEGFDLEKFSQKTPQGQTLCLSNLSLDMDQSLLATVHMGIRRGIQQSELEPDGDFNFKAELFDADSDCTGTATASANAKLDYSIK